MLFINTNYYIYKYVNSENGEIFYIGQTINLESRIKDHSVETKFLPYIENQKIYFINLASEEEMDFYEAYLIAKYKPVLNEIFVGHSVSLDINEPEWVLYDDYLKEKNNKQKEFADRRKQSFIDMMKASYNKQLEDCNCKIENMLTAHSVILSLINSAIPGVVKCDIPENLNETINAIDVYITLTDKNNKKIEEIKEELNELLTINSLNGSINFPLIKEIKTDEYNAYINIHIMCVPYLLSIIEKNYKKIKEELILRKEEIEEKIKEITL